MQPGWLPVGPREQMTYGRIFYTPDQDGDAAGARGSVAREFHCAGGLWNSHPCSAKQREEAHKEPPLSALRPTGFELGRLTIARKPNERALATQDVARSCRGVQEGEPGGFP